MFSRISSAALLLAVAACGGPPDSVAPGNTAEIGSGTPAEDPTERIACAIGDADYADACSVDRATTADGTLLTIRHPDGGFRRIRMAPDGTPVAADGAIPLQVLRRGDGVVEVAVGDARYRLPLPR